MHTMQIECNSLALQMELPRISFFHSFDVIEHAGTLPGWNLRIEQSSKLS
jgi:hypothetical protein